MRSKRDAAGNVITWVCRNVVMGALEDVFGMKGSKHVFDGKRDPGGWAPRAKIVVHAEALGIGLHAAEFTPQFERFCKLVNERTHGMYFVEPVNMGVWAVYLA